MEKDALYWGIVAIFGSFILMIVWFVYDVWKTGQEMERLLKMEAVATESLPAARDFSEFETVSGKDGRAMVLVPEGPFQMGSLEGEGDLDEFPLRSTYLSPYYMDLYEVTFLEFNRFTDGAGFPPPSVPVFEQDLSLITSMDQPVVGVSWDQARLYCEWAGKRLPTEAEWEKAAKGERNLQWPWGNTFEEGLSNTLGEDDGYQYSAPPGKYELGRSAYGLYDMAGNVAEWVADIYDPKYYGIGPFRDPQGPDRGKHHVYRGGSWNDSLVNVRTAKRFAAARHQAGFAIGFRCASDAV